MGSNPLYGSIVPLVNPYLTSFSVDCIDIYNYTKICNYMTILNIIII